MRYILAILLLFLTACKKEQKKDNPDRAALHGVWESYAIRSKYSSKDYFFTLEVNSWWNS